MLRRRLSALLLAASVAVAVAGCASFDSTALRVSIAGIGLADSTLLEQRYTLTIRLQNPSEREVRIDGLAYDLIVNGRLFARGVSDRTVVVPRFGEQTIDVTAVGPTGAIFRHVLDIGQRTRIEYRLVGRTGGGGVFGGALRFDGRGEIPIPPQLLEPFRK
jgi:LEA14-like dessication related protein